MAPPKAKRGWGKAKVEPEVPKPPPPPPPPTVQFQNAVNNLDVMQSLKLAPVAYATWWTSLLQEHPWHVVWETILFLFIVYLLFMKKNKSRNELTEKDVDELVADWKPEPLVPNMSESDKEIVKNNVVITEYLNSNEIRVEGEHDVKLNMVTMSFLGLSDRAELQESALETLNEYGCGSCGPRGFYGSVMPHIEIENAVASFMGTEGAITYSDSASCESSTVPAFAKRGDLIVADDAIHEAIKTGVELSRAKVIYFKHNDVSDLERVLKAIQSEDRKSGRDVTKQRRFIVSEGLFKKDGTIAPLKQLVDLKNRFHFRLILDECLSFGVLGKTGRGLTEHLDLPVTEVDMIIVSLEHGLASIGGLCLGNIEVVDHQRLSGAGYCFSAAAPPFVSSVALRSLKILQSEPKLILQLEKNSELVHKLTSDTCAAYLNVISDKKSPILIAALTEAAVKKGEDSFDSTDALVSAIARECMQRGVYVAFDTDLCVRLVVRSTLSEKQIKMAVSTLKDACVACLGKLSKTSKK